MAYEFQKLADVEAVEEFPEEGASVLIEHEGGIKKCPADGIGGGGAHIYRFEVDFDTANIHPTEQCDENTIADDLASGLTPFALVDQSDEYSIYDTTVSLTIKVLMPFLMCTTLSGTGGEYDGYKEVTIMFKVQQDAYNSYYISGSASGRDAELEWEYNLSD